MVPQTSPLWGRRTEEGAPGSHPTRTTSSPGTGLMAISSPRWMEGQWYPLPLLPSVGKRRQIQASLSESSGVEGAGRDRTEAAGTCCAVASVPGGLCLQPLGFGSTPGLALALGNCVCVLIGATMLYNAYIISQAKCRVSAVRSHRLRVHVGGKALWELEGRPVPRPHPTPAWILLLLAWEWK